jgi:hypothetical protein
MARQATTNRRKTPATASPTAQGTAPQSGADTTAAPAASISPVEFRHRVSEAAYYRAQQRGFAPGWEERDWLEAEAEIMQRLGLRAPPH